MGYNPSVGQFVQRDPIGYADGMNLYQYVRSNPIAWTDPLGLQTKAPTSQPSSQPSGGYSLPGIITSLGELGTDPTNLSNPLWDIAWVDDSRYGFSTVERGKDMRGITRINSNLKNKPCLAGCILAGESKHIENWDRVLAAWRTRRGNPTHPKWNDITKLMDKTIRPWSEIDAATEAINCLRAAMENQKLTGKCQCTESKAEFEEMIKGLENFRAHYAKEVKGKKRPDILKTPLPKYPL